MSERFDLSASNLLNFWMRHHIPGMNICATPHLFRTGRYRNPGDIDRGTKRIPDNGLKSRIHDTGSNGQLSIEFVM